MTTAKKTAMELIDMGHPALGGLLRELNFSAYFLGGEIWVRSEKNPGIDMPLELFRAAV